MQTPAAGSSRLILIGLILGLLLSLPVFLMMFIDVKTAPLAPRLTEAHAQRPPAPAKAKVGPAVTPPAAQP